jgi:hypothetical protein
LKNFYLDSISDDFLVVDVCFRVDLAADHDVTCFGESLARDLGARILLEMGIKDGVWDLIADLVWVSLDDNVKFLNKNL